MTTQATLKLEELVREFERDIVPALIAFSQSKDYTEFIDQLKVSSTGGREIRGELLSFRKPFDSANEMGIEYRDEQFVPVLIREQHLDTKGIYHRVYMAILEEIRENLSIDGRIFIYPAIGHDWRVADAWPQSKIIGIDPDVGLTWQRLNVALLNYRAEDYGAVQRQMEESGLPAKSDLILKGSVFCLDYVDRKKARNWKYKANQVIQKLLGRIPPPPIASQNEEQEAFIKLVSSYLADGGLIIALNYGDIGLCDSYLRGFSKMEIISPQFRQGLERWKELEDRYTSEGIPLGFWHFTSEPFAYKRKFP